MAGNFGINNSQLTAGNITGNNIVGLINFCLCKRRDDGTDDHEAERMEFQDIIRAILPDGDDVDLKYPRELLETRMSNCEEVFVQTQAFEELKKILTEKHRVVLTGPPGEGKTTMGIMMCKHLMDEGFIPLFYDTLEAVPNDLIAKTKKNVFVVIDDFLGKSHFDPSQGEEKQRYLSALREIQLKNRREREQSKESQMPPHEPEQKLPMLLLLISRDNVYQQAIKVMTEDISSSRHTLSSSTSLLPHEKRKLLENHSQKEQRRIDEDQIEAILKMDCPFAFPKMCHLYSVMTSKDLDPIQFFQSLKTALKDELFSMMNSDPLVKASLTLLHLEQILSTVDVEDPQSKGYRRLTERLQMIKKELPLPELVHDEPSLLKNALESMCGGLLVKECGYVAFSHDSVRDAVSLALAKDHVAFVAQHCSLDFINEHVHLSKDTGSGSATVQVRKDQHIFFVRRLVNEVERRNLKGAFTCPLIQNSEFLSSFIVNLKKSEKIKEVVHYNDESEGVCFLFWLSITSSSQLREFCCGDTFSNEEIWQAFCGCCMMGQADQLEFLHDKLTSLPEWTKSMYCLHLEESDDSSTSNTSRVRPMLPSNPGSLAAAHGHAKVLDLLQGFGMPVDVKDSHGQTPLMHASREGHEDVVDLLLDKHKANPEIPDSCGSKALHLAIQFRNTKIARSLIQRAKESNDVPECLNKANFQGQTVLMLACFTNPQLAHDLLALKARTDLKDKQGRSCLHYACGSGDPQLIRKLVQTYGMNVNEEDDTGLSPLHRACFKPGNQNIVKALLDVGADPHKMALGGTALHVACTRDLETVKILLQRMQNINEADEVCMTPLCYACIFDQTEIVKYLLEKDASVEFKDPDENTVLHVASRAGSVKAVNCLLEKKPLLLDTVNRASHTPFFDACLFGHIHVGLALIQKKADVDKRDHHGRNVLHDVASTEHMTTIKFLVEKTTLDINSKDKTMATPLMLACFYEMVCVACYLVEKGADVQARDIWGNTVLHYAASSGKGSALVCSSSEEQGDSKPELKEIRNGQANCEAESILPDKEVVDVDQKVDHDVKVGVIGVLLNENLLNVDVRNKHKNTPMLIACLSGDVTKLDHLIKKGADPYARDQFGNTAMHHGSSEGHQPVLKFLIANTQLSIIETNIAGETPLDVAIKNKRLHVYDFIAEKVLNHSDNAGNSPLHTAAKSGNVPAAEKLLNVVKISVDVQNNEKQTPLHCASGANEKDMVVYLLQRGASTRAEARDGQLPLHYAVCGDHLATVKVLLRKDPPTIDSGCQYGRTPLCYACKDKVHSPLAQYFITEDNSATHRENGDTSLHVAARRGYLNTVTVLVEQIEKKVDDKNINEETPLHCACAAEKEDVAKYLIGKGASTSIQCRGETALHTAARRGSLSLVKALVEKGNASITTTNKSNQTPEEIAREAQNTDVQNYLRERKTQMRPQYRPRTPSPQPDSPQQEHRIPSVQPNKTCSLS